MCPTQSQLPDNFCAPCELEMPGEQRKHKRNKKGQKETNKQKKEMKALSSYTRQRIQNVNLILTDVRKNRHTTQNRQSALNETCQKRI